MMVRLLALVGCVAFSYALLRGWPGEVPALLRACLAVFLLVGSLSWWAMLGRGGAPVAKGGRRPGVLDFLSIGAGIIALNCGFLWLLSAAPKPLEEVAMILEERFLPAAAAERKARSTEGVARDGNWLWENHWQRSLPRRTNLKPGEKPEVFVRLASAEQSGRLLARQVYVSAFAFDRYERGAWSPSAGAAGGLVMDADGWIRFAPERRDEIVHEIFHGKNEGGQDVLVGLQGARAAKLPVVERFSDGLMFLPEAGGDLGYAYEVRAVPLSLGDLQGEVVPGEGRGNSGDSGLGGRFEELALQAAGEGGLLMRLKAMEAFLRDGYGYSLVTRNERNLDPLANFLFEEKRGHCEFFATAGALMTRVLGVPSRVAYGWAAGQFYEATNMFVFRARDAHAWVEVWLEGYGWVVMDPTPPSEIGGGASRRAEAGEVPPPVEEEWTTDDDPAVGEGARVGKMALILMGAFGLPALGLFFLRGRKPVRRNGVLSPEGLVAATGGGYWKHWKAACAKRGRAFLPGVTLRRQVSTMKEKPDVADELLAYDYAVRYGRDTPDAGTEKRLIKAIRQWEKE